MKTLRAVLLYRIPEEYEKLFEQAPDLVEAAQNIFGQIIEESSKIPGTVIFVDAKLVEDD